MVAKLHPTVQIKLLAIGPPCVSERTAFVAFVIGWTFANARNQLGMVSTDVKTELAKTSGKIGRKPANCAVS